MFTKILIATALAAIAHANTEIADTCLAQETHLYGEANGSDLAFTDYTYLYNSEVENTVYRMTMLTMCTNLDGDLTGMRSIVTRFNAETMVAQSIISMNKVGSTDGTGISCSSMALDAINGEYLDRLDFAFVQAGQMDYVKAVTNKGQQLSKGTLTDSMTASEMTSTGDKRILAFHGFENTKIASVGQVSVDLSCIKGVTTIETVEEPTLIDITTLNQPEVAQSEQVWIYILFGALGGVAIMTALLGIFFMYKKKMACFRKVSANQTMAIETFEKQQAQDEFEGQNSDQKRRSMKKMSRIVEVNESGDFEDSKHHSLKPESNLVTGAQLQSMQSLAHETDGEENTQVKHSS